MLACAWRRWVTVLTAGSMILLLPPARQDASADESPYDSIASSHLTLRVGQVGQMATRNPLPAMANDVWTQDVHRRVYESVLQFHSVLDRPTAFIGKGTDFDEDTVFEAVEYDAWSERSGMSTPLEVEVYYDFNGVRWHDGVQMTPWDLLFSYHVNAQNGRLNVDLRPLFCDPGFSYEGCGRQLGIDMVDRNPATPDLEKNWEGEGTMAGDPNLRVAIRYRLSEPSAQFYESALFPTMLPMHIWSRTGGGRHVDFGCAVWIPPAEATRRGIPECGNSDPAKWGKGIATAEPVPGSRPYSYVDAEGWSLADQDVVGHGPFRFFSFASGVETVLVRNDDYYTGVDTLGTPDPLDDVVVDGRLGQWMHRPTIEEIRFHPYADTALCSLAVNTSAEDYCHVNVPTTLIPYLQNTTGVAVEMNAEVSFHYAAYNMRKSPFGYRNGDPADDVGYWFRQAVSHLLDRDYYVQTLRDGFAEPGYGVVSPANTFWHNASVPRPAYNLSLASAILDGQGWIDTDLDGFRELDGIGDAPFNVSASNFDPARLNASVHLVNNMVAVGLNAVLVPMTTTQLAQNLTLHTFDMYVLGWRISGTADPDYMWNFFHSMNADTGQNYPGFRNGTFDTVINASRTEMNRDLRRQEILYAQGIVAEARAYEVFYYLANLEVYRQDRFVNWTVQGGTIWNYWSLLGIRPPAVEIMIDTSPLGLQVSVNGTFHTAPYMLVCNLSSTADIGTVSPQVVGQTRFTFSSWSDGGSQTHVIACDDGRTITATFATEHQIVIDTLPSGLQVVLNGSLVTAPQTYWCEFGSTFDVGVPSPQIPGPTRHFFLSWSDGMPQNHTVACSVPLSLVAEFITDFETIIDTSPTGFLVQLSAMDFPAPYTFWCPEGWSRPVDAYSVQDRAGIRYAFAGWSDGAPQSRVITCDAPGTYVALYGPSAYEVTIDTDPSGLQIEVDGQPHATPYTFWCSASTAPVLAAPSPQAVGTTRYTFGSWSDGGAQTHALPCDAPGAYVASFPTVEYEVTIDTLPAGLAVEVAGAPRSAPYTFWCAAGGSVLLNAPSPQIVGGGSTRHNFASWSDGLAQGHALTCTGPMTLTADFDTEHQIALTTVPAGLAFEVDGTAIPSPFWCTEGDSFSVSVPSPQGLTPTRQAFASWSDGGPRAHTVMCDAPSTLAAQFVAEHEVVIDTAPAGLEIVVGGIRVTGPNTTWCREGSSLAVEAPTPQTLGSSPYRFTEWSDGGARSHAIACDAPGTFTATFDVEPPPGTDAPAYLVLGGIFAVVAVALGIAYLLWRRKRRGMSEELTEPPTI